MSEFHPLWWPKAPAILTYAVPVVTVTIAILIGWWIEARWQSVPHVSLFLCAVMFSAWLGGIGPGLLASLLSVLSFDYYFLAPVYSLALAPNEVPRLIFFSISAVFVGWLSAAQRRAAASLWEARDNLRQTVQQLERTNRALQTENSERKQAEQALQNAQSELARISRVTTLGEMTASIAHEINQPLAAIVNNGSACVRWLLAKNVEEAQRSAELICADGHRAAGIINRIHALAKKAPPQKSWVDLNQTIIEIIDLARNEAQKNRVSIETQLPTDLPLAFGDRIQLQQVMLNLLMNAIEAMSENTDHRRELLIRTVTDASGAIVVALRDSGPGLGAENQNRLFAPFYTTKPQGMGMGLAICRSIVEAHGGRLWATPNQDRGATFQFTVPIGGEGVTRLA